MCRLKVRPDREFKAELTRICGPGMLEVLGAQSIHVGQAFVPAAALQPASRLKGVCSQDRRPHMGHAATSRIAILQFAIAQGRISAPGGGSGWPEETQRRRRCSYVAIRIERGARVCLLSFSPCLIHHDRDVQYREAADNPAASLQPNLARRGIEQVRTAHHVRHSLPASSTTTAS